jgi:hypothetical protein
MKPAYQVPVYPARQPPLRRVLLWMTAGGILILSTLLPWMVPASDSPAFRQSIEWTHQIIFWWAVLHMALGWAGYRWPTPWMSRLIRWWKPWVYGSVVLGLLMLMGFADDLIPIAEWATGMYLFLISLGIVTVTAVIYPMPPHERSSTAV